MPVITVILPTCDRPVLVGRALASVLGQTWTDFEVILVDNNRATPPLAENTSLAPLLHEPRVRLVRDSVSTNAGQARNTGLALAQGEWVTFLDDDDEYLPDKLARQLELARETGASLVLCGYVVPLGLRRRVIQVAVTEFRGDGLLLDAIWGTPFLFMRRKTSVRFDRDLAAAEDINFAQDYLRTHGIHRVPCVPAPLVVVHPQAGARVNTQAVAHWRAALLVLRRSGASYSRPARRRFHLRARLQRDKLPGGSWLRLLRSGCALLWAGGSGEIRRVANALLLRTTWFDRWLVS